MAGIADLEREDKEEAVDQEPEGVKVESLEPILLPLKRAKPTLKVNIELPKIDLELESLKTKSLCA